MTLELYRNDDYVTTAGTNTGWNDLVRHVLEEDAREFPNAHHLAEYGWGRFAEETHAELAAILAKRPPEHEPTRKLLAHLVEELSGIDFKSDDTITVTDGLS